MKRQEVKKSLQLNRYLKLENQSMSKVKGGHIRPREFDHVGQFNFK